MNPRLFLIGIAALLLATGTAHAATPEFPKTEVLGTWCLIGQAPLSNNTASPYPYMYHRGPCKGEEWVEIKQTGYDGPGLSCKIVESNPNFSPLAGFPGRFAFHCTEEGHEWKEECVIAPDGYPNHLVKWCFRQRQ